MRESRAFAWMVLRCFIAEETASRQGADRARHGEDGPAFGKPEREGDGRGAHERRLMCAGDWAKRFPKQPLIQGLQHAGLGVGKAQNVVLKGRIRGVVAEGNLRARVQRTHTGINVSRQGMI